MPHYVSGEWEVPCGARSRWPNDVILNWLGNAHRESAANVTKEESQQKSFTHLPYEFDLIDSIPIQEKNWNPSYYCRSCGKLNLTVCRELHH